MWKHFGNRGTDLAKDNSKRRSLFHEFARAGLPDLKAFLARSVNAPVRSMLTWTLSREATWLKPEDIKLILARYGVDPDFGAASFAASLPQKRKQEAFFDWCSGERAMQALAELTDIIMQRQNDVVERARLLFPGCPHLNILLRSMVIAGIGCVWWRCYLPSRFYPQKLFATADPRLTGEVRRSRCLSVATDFKFCQLCSDMVLVSPLWMTLPKAWAICHLKSWM